MGAQETAPAGKGAVADRPVASRDESLEPLTAEAQRTLASLQASLAPDSEARAMLDEIVRGSRLRPTNGWFPLAGPQTRFPWKSVAARYDRDHDGRIARSEFAGRDEDFRRLDRDRDQAVTERDLDWTGAVGASSPGGQLFSAGDKDSNGKLTRDELLELFQELDSGGRGYLSLDEVRERFPPPGEGPSPSQADRPTRSTLILRLARQELGSLQPGPLLDELAPDFSLASLGGETVTLSQQLGAQPAVLIFGNFTCGPFRSQAGNLEKLYLRYRDRARFLVVYVREAHPRDGWWLVSNQRVGIEVSQPVTDAQRCEVAGRCRAHLDLNLPFLVDTISDTVGCQYSGMPSRLYLIDRRGRIAFKSGRGPFGFRPAELEQALIWYLAEEAAPAAPGAR